MTIKGVSGISYMHFLPCLRCGRDSVGVSLLPGASRRENVWCLAKGCEAVHYLRIAGDAGGLDVAYDRYTLGDQLECYADGGAPPPRGEAGSHKHPSEDEGFSGPVAVYPPKRQFKRAEVQAVWKASKGRCHLCGRKWRPGERGENGWRIDTVIPNAGGDGVGEPGNLRIACAACGPGKGRRSRRARLLRSIRDLVIRLTPSSQAAWPAKRRRG
ncbi:MAG TPA: hypothetical protein VKG78_02930 [Opitutaceae bacterium]|nr:hypothetical protein [Opitutaceae bacterium]